jgi:hypothetical protein
MGLFWIILFVPLSVMAIMHQSWSAAALPLSIAAVGLVVYFLAAAPTASATSA